MQEDPEHPSFDVMGLLTQHNTRWNLCKYQENEIVYSQGNPADSVFYIYRGKVKVTVISKLGKEAVVAIRGADEFCGEGAMTGAPLRLATATTMSTCEIIRLETETVVRLLHENQEFADYFLGHLDGQSRGGFGRPIIQFQRDAAGTSPFAAGQLWQ
jgi:CRP-like cAMP-binding protein